MDTGRGGTGQGRSWQADRRVEPLLLGVQFIVCIGAWTVITAVLAGTISGDGLTASVLTGAILVGITWALVKLGWDHGPRRPEA